MNNLINFSQLKKEKMETLENEPTQNLPICDREINIIMDCLTHSQKTGYELMKNHLLTPIAKDEIMERVTEIETLIKKLQLT